MVKIEVSEEEKKLLDDVRCALHRSDSVPYGEVIAEMANMVKKKLKELEEDYDAEYEKPDWVDL